MPKFRFWLINTKSWRDKMEVQFYGANCIKLTTKNATVVIDDNLKKLGQSSVAKAGDIVIYTQEVLKAESKDPKLVIDRPGEYEVSAISVIGTPARSHMDSDEGKSATIFKIVAGGIRVAVVGHVFAELNETQLESIGTVDLLIVPVGNSGYTLDALGALKIIKNIEPKIVIPTHYADSKLNYEVPQTELETAVKEMSMEVHETVPKLKLKSSELPETMQLIVLEPQG